jgi:phage terminase small subunit
MSGPLPKSEHEAFALAYVAQRNKTAAYKSAYPSCKSDGSARVGADRLLGNKVVAARIEELRTAVAAAVVERTGVDEARIVDELAKIAFSDIRKAVAWKPEVSEQIEENDDGSVITVIRTITPRVSLVDSALIDDDTAAAVASVSLSSNGTLTVKMHSKVDALKVLEDRFKPAPKAGDTIVNNNVAFIDAPPRETYEEWTARRARIAAAPDGRADRALEAPGRAASRRRPRDME